MPVEAGETVAKAKITPLAIAEAAVKRGEERAWEAGGLVAVDGFVPRTIGAVARERLEPRQRQRFESSLTEKVDWFGSRLLRVRYPAADAGSVADEMRALIAEGAEILIAAGAGSLDPLDPVFTASRASAGTWSATARPRIRAACCGSPRSALGPSWACRPAACSRRRRRRSTWYCR